MKVRLLATHPIQNLSPWLRRLGGLDELDFEVGYGFLPDPERQGVGFDHPFTWDLPFLEGYRSRTLPQWIPNPRLDRFFGLWASGLRKWLAGCDALMVPGWHSWLLVQGVLAARRLGIPVLARGDSWITSQRGCIHRWMVRLWLRSFAGFLVVGDRNRNYYLAHGVSSERLFPGPHGVDHQWFREQADRFASARDAVRQRWGVSREELVLLYVGKFQDIKNLPELFLALAELGSAAPPLVLVGSGPEESRWRQLGNELRIRLFWNGFANQSELPAIYRAADVLVLPSKRESWGLVVNEAMACGLPAIVSDTVGCMPDLIRADETGWSYPSGDLRALAAICRKLQESTLAVRGMREAVQRHVEEVCGLDRLVAGTLAALRAVARSRAA